MTIFDVFVTVIQLSKIRHIKMLLKEDNLLSFDYLLINSQLIALKISMDFQSLFGQLIEGFRQHFDCRFNFLMCLNLIQCHEFRNPNKSTI